MHIRLTFILAALLLLGCSKQEIIKYEGENALSFYRNATTESDSLSYSFATLGIGKVVDTLYLKMRVIGAVSNTARPMKLRMVQGTAREGIDFKLPDYSVPAGASTFLYPLILFKTSEMKTNSVRVVLEAEHSGSFEGIAAEGLVLGKIAADNTVSLKQMKIDIADKIIKPSFWTGTMDGYFGAYSNAKYTFMIQTMGTADFRSTAQGGTWTTNDYILALVKLRSELLKYEAVNGPLLDENGSKVEY